MFDLDLCVSAFHGWPLSEEMASSHVCTRGRQLKHIRLSVQEVPALRVVFPRAYYELNLVICFWLVWYVICTFCHNVPLFIPWLLFLSWLMHLLSSLHDHYVMCIICGDVCLVVLFMVFSAMIQDFHELFFESIILLGMFRIINAWIYASKWRWRQIIR